MSGASPVEILAHAGGIALTNCYLVVDRATGSAVLFDAPNDTATPLLDEAEKRGATLQGLWLTHGHFDHLADHAVVRARFPSARILIHPLDEPKLNRPGSRLFPLPFEIPPGAADERLSDGQTLRIGQTRVDVLHTPGHSPGHVSFHLPDAGVLIGGDLIIGGAVGRTDLPDSDPAALDASIRRVMRLEGATTLLGGHGEPSTLEHERAHNPYVRAALGLS